MSEILSRIVVLVAGTLYPAYRSYKAVRTKNVREYVKWMMYWIVFALFQLTESVLDLLLAFWFPFYYQFKIIFVIYLLSPWTKGASILYRKWIHPALMEREKDIDALLDQAKSESYNQLIRFGSQSLLCAKDIVATATQRGHEQILLQLQKSYSANDVNVERPRKEKVLKATDLEEVDEDDPVSDHEFDEEKPQPRPRRSGHHSRSRSKSRNLDQGEEDYPATMPRRSQRRL